MFRFPSHGPAERHAGTAVPAGAALQLTLASGALTLSFATLCLLLTLLPLLEGQLRLTAAQSNLAIALPVLLGSIARIPMGALADRISARLVLAAALSCGMLALVALPFVGAYWQLLACVALGSISFGAFPAGAALVSRWHPAGRQGTALGILGLGSVGAAPAILAAPFLTAGASLTWGTGAAAGANLLWVLVLVVAGRDAARVQPPINPRETPAPYRSRACAHLSVCYFVTFVAFLATAAFLPTFLTDIYGLTPRDATARTAGFVIVAAIARPFGGFLADRTRAEGILVWVFRCTAVMAALMMWPHILSFTIGALGMAAAIGFGNGAVLKLVAAGFPRTIGAATGIVGAAGGLGGFVPVLLLGVLPTLTGSYAMGFMLLTMTAIACSIVVNSTTEESGRDVTARLSPTVGTDRV